MRRSSHKQKFLQSNYYMFHKKNLFVIFLEFFLIIEQNYTKNLICHYNFVSLLLLVYLLTYTRNKKIP